MGDLPVNLAVNIEFYRIVEADQEQKYKKKPMSRFRRFFTLLIYFFTFSQSFRNCSMPRSVRG